MCDGRVGVLRIKLRDGLIVVGLRLGERHGRITRVEVNERLPACCLNVNGSHSSLHPGSDGVQMSVYLSSVRRFIGARGEEPADTSGDDNGRDQRDTHHLRSILRRIGWRSRVLCTGPILSLIFDPFHWLKEVRYTS